MWHLPEEGFFMEKTTIMQQAVRDLKDLRKLLFAALICALSVVVSSVFITVGENLRIYFTFFLTAVGASVYGPIVGVLAAIVTDTLSFFAFPSGPYFPGYMLSEVCNALIYSIFLYRRKITLLRLFSARLLVNGLVNVLLGSLWSKMLFGQGYLFYLVKSVVKNALLLPLEVIALAALFALLIPPFSRLKLLPPHEKKDLRQLGISQSVYYIFSTSFALAGACSLYYGQKYSESIVFTVLGCVLLLIAAVIMATKLFVHRNEE